MRNLLIPGIVAGLLLALHAIPEGNYSARWHAREANQEQREFARRLAQLPFEFGDWQSEDAPIDPREHQTSGAVGDYQRVFRNRYDPKKKVTVYIACGNPVDMAIHNPERCYKAAGATEDDTRTKYAMALSNNRNIATFWTNRFKSGTVDEGQRSLRIFWSFSSDGKWVAPSNARWSLGREAAVYKIYALSDVPVGKKDTIDDSPARELLDGFMPIIQQTLFPEEAKPDIAPPSEKPAETPAASPAAPPAATTEPPADAPPAAAAAGK
jgi:Protein of unknown function (DUF3485)